MSSQDQRAPAGPWAARADRRQRDSDEHLKEKMTGIKLQVRPTPPCGTDEYLRGTDEYFRGTDEYLRGMDEYLLRG